MVSLLVVFQEALHAATAMLISEIIARVPMRGMIGLTVVFGRVNLLVVFQEVLHAIMMLAIIAQAQAMKRIIVSAEQIAMALQLAGKVQFKYLVSTQ